MTRHYLIDTGPIVAVLNSGDEHHAWAAAQIKEHQAPFSTCEAVLSEAFHLLAQTRHGPDRLLRMIERGFLRFDFSANDQMPALARLLRRYADLPMSFADACLVRMTELDEKAAVFTLDRDFLIYRKNSRQIIPLLSPPQH
ncbi:PIN domain-containing protein [soil metagenome]